MKVPGQTLKGGVISQRLEKVNFCLVPGWAERVRGDESIEKLHPASQSEHTVSPQRHQASPGSAKGRCGLRQLPKGLGPQRHPMGADDRVASGSPAHTATSCWVGFWEGAD